MAGWDANDLASADPRAPGALVVSNADLRTQDGRRSVFLSRERVTIERTFCDIAMRVSIPVEAYRGVCVALRPKPDGKCLYAVRLEHRDPELGVTLTEALEDRTIWADWRAWARFFELPALVEHNDGPQPWSAIDAVSPALPAKRRIRRRRRPGLISKRVAHPAAMSVIHREAELIARR